MKYIAFDLGNVIFDFDMGPFYETASDFGVDVDDLSFYRKIIEKAEFCGTELKDLLEYKFSKGVTDQLLLKWREGLKPNHHMLLFLESLGRDFEIAFLSNIGWEHLRYLEDVYPNVMRLASHKHMSCEVGVAKPGILFFQSFLLQHPEYSNCIYLDDREENVISAYRCGFNSIRFSLDDYENDDRLKDRLEEIKQNLLGS